jgi:CBS domain-containing protein
MAREIAALLKKRIEKGEFLLSEPSRKLPTDTALKPMKQTEPILKVGQIMAKKLVTVGPEETLERAAVLIKQHGIDHLPVVEKGRLVGIVTSWDIAVSVGTGKRRISEIMTREVVTARESEPVEVVIRRLEQHRISGVPVVDERGALVGIVTTDDISKALGRRK